MRKFIHGLLMLFGALTFIFGGIMGIFASGGLCSFIWGNQFLAANQNSIEHPHFSVLVFIGLFPPFMLIGFSGGLLLCYAIQAYADWKFGDKGKAEAFAKFKHWVKGP